MDGGARPRRIEYLRGALSIRHVFPGPAGELPGVLRRITVHHDDMRVLGVEVDVHFEGPVGHNLIAAGVFETDAEHRTDTFGPALSPERPYAVTLFLQPALVEARFTGTQSAADDARRLLGDMKVDPTVGGCEAWVFLSVGQPIPGRRFEAGFRHAIYGGMPDAHLLPPTERD